MAEAQNLLIIVDNTEAHSQYASYVVAFMAKKLGNVPNVTIFYGPKGVKMTQKGELAKIAISSDAKDLIASQFEGLSASDLPDNLEQMARFEKDQLGVTIASCATFHVIDGFAKAVDDTSNIEDFIVPLKLPQAWEGIAGADKIVYA
jgi:predicted peroxiredoxin